MPIKIKDAQAGYAHDANLDTIATATLAGSKTAALVHLPAGDNAMLPFMNKVMQM